MPAASAPALTATLRLTQALQLARQGKLSAAQQILCPTGAEPETAVELQALAALVTLAGDYPRALALWQRLQTQEPQHAEAARMIACIELWQSRPAWYRYIPWALGGLAAVLVLGLVLWASSTPPPKRPAPILHAPASAAPAQPKAAPAPAKEENTTIRLGVPAQSRDLRKGH